MTRFPFLAGGLLLALATAGPAAAQFIENPFVFPAANDGAFCRDGVIRFLPNGDTERPPESLKCGNRAVALGEGATAVGVDALALTTNTTVIGRDAFANEAGGTVLGARATATAANATAIGSNALVVHAGSTVIGANATSTAPNQVTLGAPGTSVRVGDIAASTGAQAGPVTVVTVDDTGTLGRDRTLIPAIQGLVQASVAQNARLAAVEAQQALLSSSVDSLFDLRQLDRRDMRQGIAAAVAMGQPHMPSGPGRTSYVLNVSTFRGEQAIGGALMHRLRSGAPLAISAGFSYAGNRNNAARVGIAGEF